MVSMAANRMPEMGKRWIAGVLLEVLLSTTGKILNNRFSRADQTIGSRATDVRRSRPRLKSCEKIH
jgi:hypothetical protein